MKQQSSSREGVRRLALAAMLIAIVFVLQLLGSMIKLGIFSTASLVLIPIVIGAALLGWQYGALLGFVFGVAVLVSGDATIFMEITPLGTIITVLVKGILAGLVSGLVYSAFSKKHPTVGAILAAIACPLVNTGVFLLGCRVFFWEDLPTTFPIAASYPSTAAFVILGLIGVNFILELALNCVLSPVAVRLISVGNKNS